MSSASVTRDNWWALVLGGVVTLIFGVAAVFWPGLTMTTLLYLFSAYVLISGVLDVTAGLSNVGVADTWFLPIVLGAFEIGVGVYLLRHPGVKFETFILLIGFTLIARGVIEAASSYFAPIVAAKARALNYLSGLGALVAGIVILFAKHSGGVSFVWILGLYAIVVGTLQLSAVSERIAVR
ncbi:MAG TPA: DUF308 domain-containing protein [Candidatus Saccharimonadales bacterium]|nr:DUF308 domain-containing protein [Candidatus Saccharimonadales bacterium]